MKIKVVILYRVVQEWRSPIFQRLSDMPGYDVTVLHGPDFSGTKVISTKTNTRYNKRMLASIRVRHGTNNGMAMMPLSINLFAILARIQPDIVLCEGPSSNLLNDIIAHFYCKVFKKKIIYWGLGKIENRTHHGIRIVLGSTIRALEKRADGIVAYSNYGKQYFKDIGIQSSKIFVPVNVIDTDLKLQSIAKYQAKTIYDEKHLAIKFVILYVGALDINKKVDLLIEAFFKLESDYPGDVQLNIIGDGAERKRLESMVDGKGNNDIQFLGKMFNNLTPYYLESDVFVMPGLGGLAISEAMVHGLPVIASIGDGSEKDLIIEDNGIIDKNLSADKLYKYLKYMVVNPDKTRAMGLASAYRIEHKYNINTYMSQLCACIDATKRL